MGKGKEHAIRRGFRRIVCPRELCGNYPSPDIQEFSLTQILAYLRISRWDSHIFLGCYAVVREQVKSAPALLRRDLYDVIQLVWDTYYPPGEAPDLPFKLGLLLYDMAYYAKVLGYFQHALTLQGRDAGILYNMGLCHYALRRPWTAPACFESL